MDLENYKKVWSDEAKNINSVSKSTIYKMAHTRSSSIVKWIFIISILEFIFMNSLYFFVDLKEQNDQIARFGMTNLFLIIQIITYGILFYFLYQFYINYRNISVIESTKELLSKIIKTRKTVRNYIAFNLLAIVFTAVLVCIGFLRTTYSDYTTSQSVKFTLLFILLIGLFIGLIWLIYQVLYGILLKKLYKNYREIARLEEE